MMCGNLGPRWPSSGCRSWGSVSKLRVCDLDREAGLRFLCNVLSWTHSTCWCGDIDARRHDKSELLAWTEHHLTPP
jgi:hypothetical protein